MRQGGPRRQARADKVHKADSEAGFDILMLGGELLVSRPLLRAVGHLEALFLSDLLSIGGLRVRRLREGREEGTDGVMARAWYFPCSVLDLSTSGDWPESLQKKLLRSLKSRGYVSVEKKGLPPKRYVRVNAQRLFEAVAANHKV